MTESLALLTVRVAGLVLPTLTNTREHWTRAAERAQEHRGQARLFTDAAIAKARCRNALRIYLEGPGLYVLITRIAKRRCDHGDGTNTACKHVRDGVADALKVDDGDGRIEWRYRDHELALERFKPEAPYDRPGALIHVFARTTCECCGQFVAG